MEVKDMIRLFFILLLPVFLFGQGVVDISIKGYSDGKKENPQKDRIEAIMDAKKQAIEYAGVEIESYIYIEDSKIINSYIESKANGVLLPGYNIIDVGYTEKGVYIVVLTGKVISKNTQGIDREIKYALKLLEHEDQRTRQKGVDILNEIIKQKDDISSPQAYYYLFKSGYGNEDFYVQFSKYYPSHPLLEIVSKRYLAEYHKKHDVNLILKYKPDSTENIIKIRTMNKEFFDINGTKDTLAIELYFSIKKTEEWSKNSLSFTFEVARDPYFLSFIINGKSISNEEFINYRNTNFSLKDKEEEKISFKPFTLANQKKYGIHWSFNGIIRKKSVNDSEIIIEFPYLDVSYKLIQHKW